MSRRRRGQLRGCSSWPSPPSSLPQFCRTGQIDPTGRRPELNGIFPPFCNFRCAPTCVLQPNSKPWVTHQRLQASGGERGKLGFQSVDGRLQLVRCAGYCKYFVEQLVEGRHCRINQCGETFALVCRQLPAQTADLVDLRRDLPEL